MPSCGFPHPELDLKCELDAGHAPANVHKATDTNDDGVENPHAWVSAEEASDDE